MGGEERIGEGREGNLIKQYKEGRERIGRE